MAKGQWEFQIFGKGSKRAADEMWIARYLLLRLCERYGVDVNWHCKPLGAEVDWNGSGMHTNFSTKYMREVGGKEYFEALMAAFDEYKDEHIEVYGPDNHLRLTGLHETQSIDTFNCGVADRAPRSACRTASSRTATAGTSRTAARTRRATRTGSPAGSSRRSLTVPTGPAEPVVELEREPACRMRELAALAETSQGESARVARAETASPPGWRRAAGVVRGSSGGRRPYSATLWRGRRRPSEWQ